MDFTLTPDHELLVETVARLLARDCPPELLRAHMDDPAAADALWDRLGDFTALGDGPMTDLVLVLEQTGYVAAPTPFFATTALYRPLLRVLGIDDDRVGTVAIAGADGYWRPAADPVKRFVPDADRAEVIAVIAPGDIVTFASDLPVSLITTTDSTRRLFSVDTGAMAPDTAVLTDDALAEWTARALVALAAETVGTARRLFDMTLAYAKARVQFDVAIGSFQALQHKLADMALDVERATSAVRYAAMTIDADDPDRDRAALVAQSAAGTAATRAAKDGVQIHGGIGYTWEHDLHLFIRRAYGSEHWMGTSAHHHDVLADLLFA